MTFKENGDYTAFLARDIGEHMISRLELMALQPNQVVVLGVMSHFVRGY